MADNQTHLDEARADVRQFESQKEPERLREAYLALENVALANEPNPSARTRVREECLVLWLGLVDILDHSLDPNFNPDDLPELHVQPPRTPDGVQFPAMDPASIEDPKARAEYEKAIAANREKAIRYRLQIQLGRLKDRIPEGAVAFMRNSYSANASDQTKVKTAINKLISSPQRKAELLRLVAPRQR